MANEANPAKVITGPGTRWSYISVWEPKGFGKGTTPKYRVTLIIPKSDTKTVEKIRAAVKAAYEIGQAKLMGNGKTVPPFSTLKTPLRNGDVERPDDPAFEGCWFLNASSDQKPGIVDLDRNPILDRREVYSGVYGRASVTMYAYSTGANRGIACGLNNLQKTRDGDPLTSRASAASDFADDDGEDIFGQ